MNLYHNLLALTFKAPTNVGNYPACLIHHCIESQLNSTETGLSATSSMSSIVPIDTDPISPHYFCSLLCLIYLVNFRDPWTCTSRSCCSSTLCKALSLFPTFIIPPKCLTSHLLGLNFIHHCCHLTN